MIGNDIVMRKLNTALSKEGESKLSVQRIGWQWGLGTGTCGSHGPCPGKKGHMFQENSSRDEAEV